VPGLRDRPGGGRVPVPVGRIQGRRDHPAEQGAELLAIDAVGAAEADVAGAVDVVAAQIDVLAEDGAIGQHHLIAQDRQPAAHLAVHGHALAHQGGVPADDAARLQRDRLRHDHDAVRHRLASGQHVPVGEDDARRYGSVAALGQDDPRRQEQARRQQDQRQRSPQGHKPLPTACTLITIVSGRLRCGRYQTSQAQTIARGMIVSDRAGTIG